ncbi:hypothetical protein N7475_008183 [Penicillium sp. IBT 31633x]|nr:hypothetical protein N7475_008183 [Penicillium sp. IBT 31633x]
MPRSVFALVPIFVIVGISRSLCALRPAGAAAHRGIVFADYDVVLREADQPDSIVDRWKPAFKSHYIVSWKFPHAHGGLDLANKDLILIFDNPENTRSPSLEKWEDWKIQSNPKTSDKKIQDRASIAEICTCWFGKWVGDPSGTKPTKARMGKLRKLFHQA